MPIDRIGKGGGIPPQTPGAAPGGVGGASGPSGASPTKTFQVEAPATKAGAAAGAQATQAAQSVGVSPLEQLRAGKIDVNQYVDLKLNEATSHLRGLHPSELQQIREMLRDKIVQDPQLVDLVRQATGAVPKPTDE